MSSTQELEDRRALEDLVYRYAAAVDARDVDAFLDCFVSDARLRTFGPAAAQPFVVQSGHQELARVPPMMSERFEATLHRMSNPLARLCGDRAEGSVYCSARHLIPGAEGPRDLVVLIRYEDRYERDDDARWRIRERDIRFLWLEERSVVPFDPTLLDGRLGYIPSSAGS